MCLQFQLIPGWRIKKIRLDLKRGGDQILFKKVTIPIPQNETNFEKCYNMIKYSNAGWALVASDADGPANNPAIILNIDIEPSTPAIKDSSKISK